MPSPPPALEAVDLGVDFDLGRGRVVRAADGVSLTVAAGTTLALIGETGSGKTTVGRALAGLLRPTRGAVAIAGVALGPLWQRRWGRWRLPPTPAVRRLRQQVQPVFQDPLASLDPRLNAWAALSEPLDAFGLARGPDRAGRVAALLADVGLGASHARRLPHQLSGGQRQRLAIARALAAGPAVLVADEPTAALDVSVQAQVLALLAALQRTHHLAYLLITHDLAVARCLATEVAVMYRGRIVERAPAELFFARPAHPYARALRAAVPDLAPASPPGPQQAARPEPGAASPSDAPGPSAPLDPQRPPASGSACPYAPRCPQRVARCQSEHPALREIAPGRWAACHLADVSEPGAPASPRR